MAAYGRERGSLVRVTREPNSNDLSQSWRENLHQAQQQSLISASSAQDLAGLFTGFEQRYERAIRGFATSGVASQELQPQAQAYGELLEAVHKASTADRTRQMLLRPLLDVGTVAVEGGQPTAIIAPWHPLRMAAMGWKARRASSLIRHLLSAPRIEFGDPDLFFRELREEYAHPFYPEIAVGWQKNQPELLALTDTVADYTLHEPPLVSETRLDDTNENPTESASRVTEIVRRYLSLHPHEQANLSVVLYNCDSSRLPLAVVDKLATLDQDEEDVRCHVILLHRDPGRLAQLYEQIVDTPDSDGDGYVAGEATRDFMARLRIGISAHKAQAPDPRDGCPNDIVFSQDVIARRARLEWYPEDARPVPAETLNPAQWSRRRPVAAGDMKSVVYLTCPVQRAEGWSYLRAISSFFQPGSGIAPGRGLLPARQLDFGDATTADIFDQTHNLATWVANLTAALRSWRTSARLARTIRRRGHSRSRPQSPSRSSWAELNLGMMKVVEDMAGNMRDHHEPEPTWVEANAAFEAAEPAELVRPARKLVVVFRYADGCWSATSPDLEGFGVAGLSLPEVKAKAAEDLAAYLDPAVELDERVAEPAVTLGPRQKFRVVAGAGNVITVGTSSRSRAFVSSQSLRAPA